MKKSLLLLFLLFGVFFASSSYAYECVSTDSNTSPSDLKGIEQACLNILSSTNSEINTLKQAISAINTKVNLAQAQINQTQAQINSLEKEVTVLGGVLETVNKSMDDLSVIYLARVRESYRRSRVTPFDMIFSRLSFGDFLTKLKYLNTIKVKDQLILAELENSRLAYDQRKQEKVTKQQEVEKLKSKLVSQKKALDGQIREKQNLLTLTQNDEKKYQQLLSNARTQLAALRRYITSQGGASILSNQTKCNDWGCYYNQRDSQWGNMGLGGSSYSVAEYGCLVNSVSMMASHLGKNIKPSDIAVISSAFVPGYGWLRHDFQVNSINVSITTYSNSNHSQVVSKLDSELNAGRSVIVGLYGGPDHFIVMVKKEGDNYIMHDPFMENGSNRQFSEKYNLSDINSLRIVSFN
jgi:peptidoglycan hydrolase CwlO-like protein